MSSALPTGTTTATTLRLAQQRHMSVWMWSVDTQDWMAEGSSSSYWVDRIVGLAETEGEELDHPVVLMHNQERPMPATVAALPVIIRFFEARGYTFVDLLGRTGPPARTEQEDIRSNLAHRLTPQWRVVIARSMGRPTS